MIADHPNFDAHERVTFLGAGIIGVPAIIAIHRSVDGVGGGGVRFRPYPGEAEMLTDALRLSQAMSLKNALADIPIGGGKTVINGDPGVVKTRDLLLALGRHVESLSGAYVAGPDVGTNSADMAVIAEVTTRVIGVAGRVGDTSGPTAIGVLHGIRVTAQHLLGAATLEGVSIAVQGAGGVGGQLCRLLAADGARLAVADIDSALAASVAHGTGARQVAADAILSMETDILVPCAIGSIFSAQTIPHLRARAICGPANNQLATPDDALRLAERGILYVPDYVVSSGGAISAALELGLIDRAGYERRLIGIGHTLAEVFDTARATSITTSEAARRMAIARLARRAPGP